MVKILIDGNAIEVKEETSILEAAEQAGIFIPHLCFHPALTPEGNCRMCLVEIEGFPELELACSTKVADGMKISTQSEKVTEARKSMLEFLLAEHPLDCPICDKAGECKLQDYYDDYGLFDSKFNEKKEKKEKKVPIGKNLILDRERCIMCSCCVRFLREITHTQELGILQRGIHSEIGIYEGMPINNNYSGNLVDLCPVGAITDKDFRFKTRSWLLNRRDSICPLCSRGCNITIEYFQSFSRFEESKKVYRIKPRENLKVNGFWICDFGRYNYYYLYEDRMKGITYKKIEKESQMTWENTLNFISEKIKSLYHENKTSRIALICSSWLSNEELFLLKKIFKDDLEIENIYLVDPLQGESDGLLLTSDRSPNTRGAKEIGIKTMPLNIGTLSKETDLIIICGYFLVDHLKQEELKVMLKSIETKVLLTAHNSELDSFMDIVLPIALIAEKDGSLTNTDGFVQYFSSALKLPGESRPEWKIFIDLAKRLRLNPAYYNKFSSIKDIQKQIREEIPFFEEEIE